MKSLIKYVFISIVALTVLNSCTERSNNEHSTQIETNIDPISRLLKGNKRLNENHAEHPDQGVSYIRSLKKGQHPFAVIVGCSDSRVPPELLFDQGFGDLFVIRTAGNVIGDYEIGSIEYAVEHLHSPLVVVLGHQNCGAISAYTEHLNDSVPGHIQHLIDYIKDETEEKSIDKNSQTFLQESILANIRHGVNVLNTSEPIIKKLVDEKKVRVVGAIYNLDNSTVEIVN